MDAQIPTTQDHLFLGMAMPNTVHREHPSPRAASPGRVIGVVVKYHHVARIGLQRHAAGKIAGRNAKELERAVHINRLLADEMFRVVAAGQNAQTAGIARERIQVEGDLHSEKLSPVAVWMPAD